MTSATHYSRAPVIVRYGAASTSVAGVALIILLFLTLEAYGQTGGAITNGPALRAAGLFQHAQREHLTQPDSPVTAWHFARACFDWAEFSTNSSQRAELAQQGITASRAAIRQDSNSAPAHLYLGMNLGQLARTKSLGALPLVNEMEKVFLKALKLDELFNFAGPDRLLGQLYFHAPSIGSVGSRSKARRHLKRALELAPEYPENRLNWIEAAEHWRETESARRELAAFAADLDHARAQFNGDAWEAAWTDWDGRLQKVRSKLRPPFQSGTSPPSH